MNLTLKVLEKGELIQQVHWDTGVYRIGRSEFSDLILNDESVSRSHLEVKITEHSIQVINATLAGELRINGTEMESADVKNGDTLGVGIYEIVVAIGASAENGADRGIDQGVDRAQAEEAPREEAQIAEPSPGGGASAMPAWAEDPAPLNDAPLAEPSYNPLAEPTAQERSRTVKESSLHRSRGTSALRSDTVAEGKVVVAKILFTGGSRDGEEISLEGYEVTLGRSSKADIRIDDDKLSRVHAKITRVGSGYRMIDLSSRHGTFVNGVRILEHPLNSFDTIEIGNVKFQFLISDVADSGPERSRSRSNNAMTVAATKSVPLMPRTFDSQPTIKKQQYQEPLPEFNPEISIRMGGMGQPPRGPVYSPPNWAPPRRSGGSNFLIKIIVGLGIMALLWTLITMVPEDKPKPVPIVQTKPVPAPELKLPPSVPREFAELSPENQRAVEGYYNSAIFAAEKNNLEDALWNLRKMRELVPYYKQSLELNEVFNRKIKEKQLETMQRRAAQNETADLSRYLQEGIEYLREGNFDLAADSFNQAITLDPTNAIAKKGLRAAEYKIKDLDQVPAERDEEREKKKLVVALFQTALSALEKKNYQEAIDSGEKIRTIELKGDTQYLNEAKVIVDRARLLQKEEFEQFLLPAKEKFAEGDYNASRDLCEEMLKRDPSYDEAKECAQKAKKQLNRLAKENYTTGYVLESMNRIEEAKQYWNRAKNFVRPGDTYYDKVMKKLDEY